MEMVATNEPPEGQRCESLPRRLLEIFRAGAGSQDAEPFLHQVQTFERILSDNELLLVAGTASGKALAVGAPLFYKLEQGEIRKVLLMYPTIALLEDQRRVMQSLAKATGLDEQIGRLQGGMSRSALIHNLNKRVLLATPDAVYWFFRKNVKYNALLAYGLCQADEFVLDETHLFNGLMLRNFEHLWRRINVLAGCLHKTPRLHILTATPTAGLGQTFLMGKKRTMFQITGTSQVAELVETEGDAPIEECQPVQVRMDEISNFHKYEVLAGTARYLLVRGRTADTSLRTSFASPDETLRLKRVLPTFWVEKIEQMLRD